PQTEPAPPKNRIVSGTLGGCAVLMARAGAGRPAAARAAEVLLGRGARPLIAAGFGGALSPDLRPGDLLLANAVIEPSGRGWPTGPGLLGRAADGTARAGSPPSAAPGRRHAPAGQVRVGLLLTVDRVVGTAEEKRRLREETGALAVDMESAAVMECAA